MTDVTPIHQATNPHTIEARLLQDRIEKHHNEKIEPNNLNDLGLLDNQPWETDLISKWRVGESGASAKLKTFLSEGIKNYKDGRNFPAQQSVSGLSPHLRWGEISVNTVWHSTKDQIKEHPQLGENANHFLTELGWREFSYSLLYLSLIHI